MGLLGLDIGTTGCKASIIDFEGNVKSNSYKEYSLVKPKPGWEELNPELVWDSVKEVIFQSAKAYNGEPIKAISISSFGEAPIPVDNNGNILYNSIIYIDKRGQDEAKYLEKQICLEKVINITGTSIHPMYSLCKIMWLKKNEPEIYKKTWKFFLYADFILFKLGAEPHIDYSLATRTMAFDIINKKWSDEILDISEVDKNKFTPPILSGSIVGKIKPALANELGLNKEILLVSGGHDQVCAALGAGIIEENIAVDGMGTVECITPAFNKPVLSKEMASNNFVCVPHVKENMYVTYAFNFTSGSILKWFRDNFGKLEIQEAKQKGLDVYEILIEKANKNPTDIFLMPHFAGAATPFMDPNSKGTIIGLTINTDEPDFIKGILEGITYEMMLNIERLDLCGIKINELKTVGGMSKSEKFLQLKANMMGKKIVSLNITEAGTLGVAILAGTASGIYDSLEDATSKLIKVKKEFYPDEKIHDIYFEKFETYKRIYPSIKNIYNK